MRIMDVSPRCPEPPSTANKRHKQQPVSVKLARALNSASNVTRS